MCVFNSSKYSSRYVEQQADDYDNTEYLSFHVRVTQGVILGKHVSVNHDSHESRDYYK
jgi:hypothetical protein